MTLIDPIQNDAIHEPGRVPCTDGSADLLHQVLDQLADLRRVVTEHVASGDGQAEDRDTLDRADWMRARIDELEQQVDELQQQNSDLAAKLANSSVRQTVATNANDTLSWEERKQAIFDQMEADTFDSEAFIESLQNESGHADPQQQIDELREQLQRCDHDIARRDEEIRELRCLLEQQSETRDGGVAIGAAAIAGLVDDDALVQQERQRLQRLQAEWEEKFRQAEIEASLERAKLSRERQELARKQTELEVQIEQLRRELRRNPGNSNARKWLIELGLSDDES